MKLVATAAAVISTAAAVLLAPPAAADMFYGNYDLVMPERRDFHTWIFSLVQPCKDDNGDSINGCLVLQTIPQPVAKAAFTKAQVLLQDNGTYTVSIDDPFGLRCGDIYYGPVVPTHDVYTWDANTLTGQMVSTFDVGCDGAPGGTHVYPFALRRM